MEAPNGFSKIAEGRDKTVDGTMELPYLELSLKSLRSAGDGGTATHDDRNVLRRSDLSAFSRYHTSATSNQAITGYGGSCSPLDNSSEAVKTESTYNMISNSNVAPLKQGSNGGSDNNNMGSTTKNVFSKPAAYKEKTTSTSAVKRIQPLAFHHPMQFRSSGTQQVIQEKVDGVTTAASIGQPGEIQCQVQVQHHYHHHHLIHRIQQQEPPDHDDLSLKNMVAAAPQCSSNMFAGPVEGKSANYSNHGSNLGSNHGSNGQNGSSTAVNAVRMNMEIANGSIDRRRAGSSNGRGRGVGSGSGVDHSRLAQTEAAMKKFKQKKERKELWKKGRQFLVACLVGWIDRIADDRIR